MICSKARCISRATASLKVLTSACVTRSSSTKVVIRACNLLICSENGWIEVNLDQVDHKRANATVTHNVETDVDTILKAGDNQLIGWTASFDTELGRMLVECE